MMMVMTPASVFFCKVKRFSTEEKTAAHPPDSHFHTVVNFLIEFVMAKTKRKSSTLIRNFIEFWSKQNVNINGNVKPSDFDRFKLQL